MDRAPHPASPNVCSESAVLRLDEYLDKVAELLEAEGVAEDKIEELLLSSGEMALEMFTLGRHSQRLIPSRTERRRFEFDGAGPN